MLDIRKCERSKYNTLCAKLGGDYSTLPKLTFLLYPLAGGAKGEGAVRVFEVAINGSGLTR